ncbi:MAG: hypothetical protein ACYC46_13390 [Acidobacteriaceae bacterium]
MPMKTGWLRFCVVVLALTGCTLADSTTFDLTGPKIEVTVTRAGKTLPIAEVPNLQPNDRLWLHPDMPATQSAHYLLIAAFLRGTTNPPPEQWFTKADVWDKKVRAEGITITVPEGAQQAVLFLAPETGGDFNTLRSAVRGKPGAFVRSVQDLNVASIERLRLEKYLSAVKQISENNPKKLEERSNLLARSLSIKIDQSCFDKPMEQQVSCLTQGSNQLVMNDGHGQSMVAELTTGDAADLIGQVSTTPLAGGGAYSPYVGSIVDIAHIMGSIHTAEYQYIPALALPMQDELNLKLNNPPSFHNPKSVLVIALPAIGLAPQPVLRAANPQQVLCLRKASLTLPVEGSAALFATSYGHDLVLHLQDKAGKAVDLPATINPVLGGFVVDTHSIQFDHMGQITSGNIHGNWGFDVFAGPTYTLDTGSPLKWTVASTDQSTLIAGHDGDLHLLPTAATAISATQDAACVSSIEMVDTHGKALPANWQPAPTGGLLVHVALKNIAPGPLTLQVKQYGDSKPDTVNVQTYTEPAHLESFTFYAGDTEGTLLGSELKEVTSLNLHGVAFTPADLSRTNGKESLHLTAKDTKGLAKLHANDTVTAHVRLKDGRVLDLPVTIQASRPKVTLIGISAQAQQSGSLARIRLSSKGDMPLNAHLSFFIKSEAPGRFPRSEKIEVATEDGSLHTTLSMADGSLTLQDAQTVLAILDPLKTFGPSVFGELRFRAVSSDGATGDWLPLANLVRVPSLKQVRCPEDPSQLCSLDGSDLFLIDSIASDPQFAHAQTVPPGFADTTISVPRPNGTLLYLKLRDDPTSVNSVALPVMPE